MKTRITNYTFDASAKTISFDDYVGISLDGVLLISNVTDNIIIYNFAKAGLGGTALTNVLTLDYDTTSMSDTDDLLIYYDDPAIDATLDDINTILTTINGHVDGIEGLLTTIDADTSILAGTDFMLGTDFSDVFGSASLVITTQADNLTNNQDTVATSSLLYGFDGSTWDRLRGDSTDGLLVNLGTNNDVVVSATDLDIRNLSQTQDAVLIYGSDDGGTTKRVIKTDSGGAIQVDLEVASVTVTSGAITETNSGGILASVQLIDDIIYTSGDALSKTAGIAAQFDDVSPGAMTENKMGPLRMSSRRELYATLRDAAGNERGLNIDANGGIAITIESAQTLAAVTSITNVVHVDDNSGSLSIDIGGTAPTLGATANATSVSGELAVMPAAIYNSTPPTITDGRYNNLQLDAKASLRIVNMDAAGNARGANVDANNNMGVVLAAETTKVLGTMRLLGNVGAVLDGVNTAATAPANGILSLGIYNSTEPSPSTGQSVGIQLDAKGRQRDVIMDAAGNTRGANVDGNNNLGVVLAAETTKVLGVVRNADGSGNLLTSTSNALDVNLKTSSITLAVSLATNTPVGSVAHDAAAASVNPLLIGAYASAAAPSDVSADTDSVRLWALRNGSQVVNLASGGTLILSGSGTATGALRVELANNGTGVIATVGSITNTVTVAGAKTHNNAVPGATNIGALTGLANAAQPSLTEGDEVLLSTNLKGGLRSIIQDAAGNDRGANVDSSNNLAVSPNTRSTDFYPMYNERDLGGGQLATDPSGALVVRGSVTTDEGAGRANFTGSSISITPGSATLTNGSTAMTGSGFATADIHFLDFVKLNADAESAWVQVSFINSDTSITLASAYTGTGGTGNYNLSAVKPSTGTGGTISVASGQLTIAMGTTAASQSYVQRPALAGSIIYQTSLSVSQRIINQDIYLGIETAVSSPKQFARFRFTSIDNTKVITETGYSPSGAPSASEMETNTVTLPSSAVSSSQNVYTVEQQMERVVFSINGVVVAIHTKRIPHTEDEGNNVGYANIRGLNGTTPATSTSIVVDYLYVKNYNRLDVFQAATDQEQIVGNVPAGTTDSGNPIKIGAVYNKTKPTLNSGQRGDVQMDTKGNLGMIIRDGNGNDQQAEVNSYGQVKVDATTILENLLLVQEELLHLLREPEPNRVSSVGKISPLGLNPTYRSAGQDSMWSFNEHGIPYTIGGHPNLQTVQLNVTDADGAQSNTALITTIAGQKIVVTHVTVTADNANTADVQARIGFGASATPGNDTAKVILSHPGIAAGSGVSLGNGAGIIGIGLDGEDLFLTCEDPVGGSLDIVVGYFIINFNN